MTAATRDTNGSDVTYTNFIERLVEAVPELQLELDEHLDTFGGILPHIFMGQLASFVPEKLSGDESDAAVAHRILAFLEQGMASPDPKVTNAIAVSFLETLASDNDDTAVEQALGPRLRQALDEMEEG
jgi:hypothetical protein